MLRRNFITICIVLGLAACGGEPPVEKAKPGEMRVTSVSVRVADHDKMDKRPQTLKLGFDSNRLVSDLGRAVTRELTEVSRAGQRPVAFLDIGLNSTIPELIKPTFIYPYSQISANIRATDAQTGKILLRRGFLVDDPNPELSLGAMLKAAFSAGKSKEKAYADVVDGFAKDLRRVLYKDKNEAKAS